MNTGCDHWLRWSGYMRLRKLASRHPRGAQPKLIERIRSLTESGTSFDADATAVHRISRLTMGCRIVDRRRARLPAVSV